MRSAAVHEGKATEEEAIGLAAGMLVAGHETTVTQIEFGLLAMFRHPQHRERLVGDPSLVNKAVGKCCACTRRAPLGRHHALSKDRRDHRGHAYSRGEQGACWNAGDVVRSAPFRRPGNLRHRTRGKAALGLLPRPHYCIGVEPARLELKVVFGSIFQRFPALRLAVAPKELKLRTSSTASTCCLLALDGLAKSNRLDAVVIARYIADLPTLEMRIDPLREKPIRQHRKICSSGGTPTAVA